MLTLEQAKFLKYGDILYSTQERNSKGEPTKWRVNGKVKLWKKNPRRLYVPLKFGLYGYGYITESNFDDNNVCNALSLRP